MRLMVVFNPRAGHRRSQKLIEPMKKYLHDKGAEVTWMYTSYPGHGQEIIADAHLDHFEGVIAAGGDGTLFEVLNGLYKNKSAKKPPLGVLPTGTGNAFARELKLFPEDWQKALDIITAGNTKAIDVGRFVTEAKTYYFINILGLGFVADVNATSRSLKLFGNFSYIFGVFHQLLFLKHYKLTLKTEKEEIVRDNVFVEISNSTFTGKTFYMAPKARIDDGLLDITLLNKVGRLRILKLFPTIFEGKHIHEPEVETFTAKHIEIETGKHCVLTPDGELFGSTPITVDVLKQDVQIFWPS
jgi:diacylglycerol kinase (ATP)